jgi:hypothetical protein
MNGTYKRNNLYDRIWMTLESELGDTPRTSELTETLCDIVSDWCPKKGDFWLNKDDYYLYVNKGWEIVCMEAPEGETK